MNTVAVITQNELVDTEIKNGQKGLIIANINLSYGSIISMYQDKEIIINPALQQMFQWTVQQKTNFIESLMLSIPTASIYMVEDEKGVWHLIDGVQRVITVLSFFGVFLKDGKLKNLYNNWSLVEGEIVKSLNGLNKNDLTLRQQRLIKMATCKVEVLYWSEAQADITQQLFNRLHTGAYVASESLAAKIFPKH